MPLIELSHSLFSHLLLCSILIRNSFVVFAPHLDRSGENILIRILGCTIDNRRNIHRPSPFLCNDLAFLFKSDSFSVRKNQVSRVLKVHLLSQKYIIIGYSKMRISFFF